MNCIQPTAPAELGPMLRPKFDSTLLIAASTCHGTPYSAPAPCQRPRSCAESSCSGTAGGGGTNGVPVLGSTWKTSVRAVSATSASSTCACSAARRMVLTGRDDAEARRRLVGHDELRPRRLFGHRHGLRRGRGGLVGPLALVGLLERDEEVVF